MKKNNRKQYLWEVHWRNAKGETIGISTSTEKGLHSMIDDALRLNAVAISVFRQRAIGRTPTLEDVQAIYRKAK